MAKKKQRQQKSKELEDAWRELAQNSASTSTGVGHLAAKWLALDWIREAAKRKFHELNPNSPPLIFMESFAYYMYLSYFPPLVAMAAMKTQLFKGSNEHLEIFITMFGVTWIWAALLAAGNDLNPELSLIGWMGGNISTGVALWRSFASIAAGVMVAAITQNVFRDSLFFATWKLEEYGIFQCFLIEFLFTFVTCCIAALCMVIREQFSRISKLESDLASKESATESKESSRGDPTIRGITEIATFVIAATILLGMPFANGGPCLNSIYSLIAAVHHRDWRMGLCQILADWAAAMTAGWFVCLKCRSTPPAVKDSEAKKTTVSTSRSARQKFDASKKFE